ncbi:nucleotidyltransferase domain-containing protein [candidate division TA06 bacterium]|uniref:Nucleotidyltransferase domain-containing protein n=1 Tax=candidate division TA06 bacterium TaxID=2250710 RepID=A0A933I870_UNCT6|nr:nucleotidyltransferase domain-containing protein [candidate division TA06 bacterium]
MEQITIPKDKLSEFCRNYHISKLSLFGSVLGDDFTTKSDVDVLVEFQSDNVPGYLGLAKIVRELSGLFAGRQVDLRTPHDLSRYFRKEVMSQAKVLYAEK